MSGARAHIVIINGKKGVGKKTLSFELALALLYSSQKTAFALHENSSLHQTIKKRQQLTPKLPCPEIIPLNEIMANTNNFDAIIVPEPIDDSLNIEASTYITLINKADTLKFKQNQKNLNNMWELKKKIAFTHNRSLNWIVCENNLKPKLISEPTSILSQISRLCGFRAAPPLNYRQAYTNNQTGISAQDKTVSPFNKELTYADICAKREIIKLAEFIFS